MPNGTVGQRSRSSPTKSRLNQMKRTVIRDIARRDRLLMTRTMMRLLRSRRIPPSRSSRRQETPNFNKHEQPKNCGLQSSARLWACEICLRATDQTSARLWACQTLLGVTDHISARLWACQNLFGITDTTSLGFSTFSESFSGRARCRM